MWDVAKEDSRFLYCHCHFHGNDDTPSLVLNKVPNNGKPKGYFYCFSCSKAGQIAEEEVDKLTKWEGKVREVNPVDWVTLNNKFRANIKENELAQTWFLPFNMLDSYGCGFDGTEWYTFPFYNERREVTGIQLRHPDGRKLSVHGSRLGMLLPYGKIYPDKVVAVCEGVSDACTFNFCTGIYTIARPCATFGEEMIRDFLTNEGFKGEILIISDKDVAGITGTNKLIDTLKGWKVSVKIPTPFKDIRMKYQSEGVEGISTWVSEIS